MPMLTTSVMRWPVWPRQAPSRTALDEAAIRSSTPLTSGITSLPSTRIGPVGAVAQGDVQHGAVLGGVDLLAGEHLVAPALDVLPAREVEQQPHGVGRDAVLGVVEQHAVQAQGEPVEALGVVREQVAHVNRFHGLGMALRACHSGV